jgi:hypothetical protein
MLLLRSVFPTLASAGPSTIGWKEPLIRVEEVEGVEEVEEQFPSTP